MRVGARKGCKEHLERSESASSRTYNIIYSLVLCMVASPPQRRFARIRSPLPQNNSKRKRKAFYLPFLLYINIYVTTRAFTYLGGAAFVYGNNDTRTFHAITRSPHQFSSCNIISNALRYLFFKLSVKVLYLIKWSIRSASLTI